MKILVFSEIRGIIRAWGFALDVTILTTCLLKWRTSFGDN